MTDDSFLYNGIDMYQRFKLRMIGYDLLMAELRARKVITPARSGAYDYGAKYHEERGLRMECTIDGELPLPIFDDLKYTLSRKGRIILWDKPDRHFVGRLYDPAEVLDYERLCMRDFELNFVCEPYAYALNPTVLQTTQSILPIAYEGTREAPARITIFNNGATPLNGVTITARERS